MSIGDAEGVVICQLFSSSVVGGNGHHLIAYDIEWRDLVIVVPGSLMFPP